MDAILKGLPKAEIQGEMEGDETGRWILLDLGEVVVHLFQEEAREYYDLDHLWADAPRLTLDLGESSGAQAKAI